MDLHRKLRSALIYSFLTWLYRLKVIQQLNMKLNTIMSISNAYKGTGISNGSSLDIPTEIILHQLQNKVLKIQTYRTSVARSSTNICGSIFCTQLQLRLQERFWKEPDVFTGLVCGTVKALWSRLRAHSAPLLASALSWFGFLIVSHSHQFSRGTSDLSSKGCWINHASDSAEFHTNLSALYPSITNFISVPVLRSSS